MRAARSRGELDFERTRRLEAIGFGWDRGGDSRWEEMFAVLADFRRLHGHCRISTLSEDFRLLGNWVHTQRTLRKQGRLDKERIDRLDAIGFTWDLRATLGRNACRAGGFAMPTGTATFRRPARAIPSWATG